MTKDELRGKLLNLTEEHFGCVLDDMADEILSLLAPELEKAEKWDKLKSLFETSCDKCFLNHICGTHGNPGAVCEDIKEAIERGLIKCPQVNCLSPECKENPECGGTGRIKAEWAKEA
jgi:hypothetical protein